MNDAPKDADRDAEDRDPSERPGAPASGDQSPAMRTADVANGEGGEPAENEVGTDGAGEHDAGKNDRPDRAGSR